MPVTIRYLIDRDAEDGPSPDAKIRNEIIGLKAELAKVQLLLEDMSNERNQTARLTSSFSGRGKLDTTAFERPAAAPTANGVHTELQIASPMEIEPATIRVLPQPPSGPPAASSIFSGRSTTPAPSRAAAASPPPVLNHKSSRSRLPYPSGDYTTDSDSRPGSPISGVASPPIRSLDAELFGTASPLNQSHDRLASDASNTGSLRKDGLQGFRAGELGLPRTPGGPQARASTQSPSPTPRKRYTVALSGRDETMSTPNGATRGDGETQTGLFRDSPVGSRPQSPIDAPERFESGYAAFGVGRQDSNGGSQSPPTIGKTPITLSRLSTSPPGKAAAQGRPRPNSTYSLQSISPSLKSVGNGGTPSVIANNARAPSMRVRAQSTIFSQDTKINAPASPTPEGKNHKRTKSGVVGLGFGVSTPDLLSDATSMSDTGSNRGKRASALASVTPSGQPFVDPLVIRKKSKETISSPVAASAKNPAGPKSFGQLVAFFDGSNQ